MKMCMECNEKQVYAHGLCEEHYGDLFKKESEPLEVDSGEEV
ncbi:hypothetical protein [Fictibacillus fluitans]|uniref:Uncharacterized protein n=1 Tax=Fictibacillus fluitans TaxID=3058422 RepID=A0ABT8HX29_9BACL|nr:hypothetical protein [Fictibacillus sp. NE201]MDN4525342.1 hypothetical protein [Fictibacillus sp. NE201]